MVETLKIFLFLLVTLQTCISGQNGASLPNCAFLYIMMYIMSTKARSTCVQGLPGYARVKLLVNVQI